MNALETERRTPPDEIGAPGMRVFIHAKHHPLAPSDAPLRRKGPVSPSDIPPRRKGPPSPSDIPPKRKK